MESQKHQSNFQRKIQQKKVSTLIKESLNITSMKLLDMEEHSPVNELHKNGNLNFEQMNSRSIWKHLHDKINLHLDEARIHIVDPSIRIRPPFVKTMESIPSLASNIDTTTSDIPSEDSKSRTSSFSLKMENSKLFKKRKGKGKAKTVLFNLEEIKSEKETPKRNSCQTTQNISSNSDNEEIKKEMKSDKRTVNFK